MTRLEKNLKDLFDFGAEVITQAKADGDYNASMAFVARINLSVFIDNCQKISSKTGFDETGFLKESNNEI